MDSSQAIPTIDGSTDLPQNARVLEGQQILLVEDCQDQALLYFQFLQLAGAKVSLECNGKAAFEAVKKSPTVYSAVVMDYLMQKVDGIIATREIRSIGYDGAIIGLSAFSTKKMKQSWLQGGCNAVLEKPFQRKELIDAICQQISASK